MESLNLINSKFTINIKLKYLSQNKIWLTNLGQKKSWVKKILGPKEFLSEEFWVPKKIVSPKQIVGPK